MPELKARTLDAIKPTDGETVFKPDGAIGGLGVRYGARGVPCFTLVYRVNAKQQRRKLGLYWKGEGDAPAGYLTLAKARELAGKIKADASRGIDTARPGRRGAAVSTDALTVRNVLVRYQQQYLATKRTGKIIGGSLAKYLIPAVGDRLVEQVTADQLSVIFVALVKAQKLDMANWLYRHAKRFFGWCVDRAPRGAALMASSPMIQMRPPVPAGDIGSRDVLPTDADLLNVWQAVAALNQPQRDACRCAILLGSRIGETRKMKWASLDFERKEWTIPAADAKNKQSRIVFLSDFAISVIGERGRIADSAFVFTLSGSKPIDRVSTRFGEIREQRGLGDLHLHDFRKSFVSECARLGHDPIVLDKCIGHDKVLSGVAKVYQMHQFLDKRKAAHLAWSDHVESLVTTDEKPVLALPASAGVKEPTP
ncbi:MAG TPA: tyrosine-type recombinase/integrase [Stellaceae bacterium]|nr:tyrosine-type recombinase/integrase [Stellaceae bacterium]